MLRRAVDARLALGVLRASTVHSSSSVVPAQARRPCVPMWMSPPCSCTLRGGRFPHHAGALARVAEGVDQRLDDLAVLGPRPACGAASCAARSTWPSTATGP